MQFHNEKPRFGIRAARDDEAATVRRLVPALYTATSAPDRVIVAVHESSDEIAGLVAIAWRNWNEPPAFPVFVHVMQSWRRQGIARALLGEAARLCRHDTQRFCTWTAIQAGSGTEHLARALGFEINRRTLYFEAEGAVFYAMIQAIHARLAQRGRIPANASVVSLRDAPHAQVARFVSESFGSRYDAALAASRGQGAHAYDADKSPVLLVDGKVQGALLYRWADGIPQIDVNLVAPHLRRGWANVALLERATRAGLEGGAERFRFHCDDTVTDTVKLARRAYADNLRITLEFSASLDGLLDAKSTKACVSSSAGGAASRARPPRPR